MGEHSSVLVKRPETLSGILYPLVEVHHREVGHHERPGHVGSVGKRLQIPKGLLYLLHCDFPCPAESGCWDSPDCFQYQLRTYREEGQPSECRECDLWSDLPEDDR